MSILNTTNDGLYNVLIVLCGALREEGRIEKNELIQICSAKDVKQVRQTLTRWTQLGLFDEDNSEIFFSKNTEKYKNKITENLPIICREIIFSKRNNENFWDSEKSKSADISRALSWLMAQDIWKLDLDSIPKIQKLESNQIIDNEKTMLQNNTRINGVKMWARFLGFTCFLGNTLVDPTVAIGQEAEILFKRDKEYAANKFLEEIAVKLPVLDGGGFRKRVEKVLNTEHWQKPPNPQILSSSLSRALWRLDQAGIIELLPPRSDAEANRVIQGQGGEELKSFTHVVYRGERR